MHMSRCCSLANHLDSPDVSCWLFDFLELTSIGIRSPAAGITVEILDSCIAPVSLLISWPLTSITAAGSGCQNGLLSCRTSRTSAPDTGYGLSPPKCGLVLPSHHLLTGHGYLFPSVDPFYGLMSWTRERVRFFLSAGFAAGVVLAGPSPHRSCLQSLGVSFDCAAPGVLRPRSM